MAEKTERQEINKKRATRVVLATICGAFIGPEWALAGAVGAFIWPIKTRN